MSNTLWETLSIVTNTRLATEDPAWVQATLPVKLGGLGIRSAVQIAPSAYLTSVAALAELVTATFTDSHCSLPAPSTNVALAIWSEKHSLEPPQGAAAFLDKGWDSLSATALADSLLESAPNDFIRARLPMSLVLG